MSRRLSSSPPAAPKRARYQDRDDHILVGSSSRRQQGGGSGSGRIPRGPVYAIGARDFTRGDDAEEGDVIERGDLPDEEEEEEDYDAVRERWGIPQPVPLLGEEPIAGSSRAGGRGGGRRLDEFRSRDDDDDSPDEDATPPRPFPSSSKNPPLVGNSSRRSSSPPMPAPRLLPPASPLRAPTPIVDLTDIPSPPPHTRDPHSTTSISELGCPICLGPPVPLAVTSCGHAFCAPCLHASLVAGPPLSPDANEEGDERGGGGGRGGVFIQRAGTGYDGYGGSRGSSKAYDKNLDKHCPVCRTVLRGGWGRSLRGVVLRMGEVRQVVEEV